MSLLHGWNCLFLFYLWLIFFLWKCCLGGCSVLSPHLSLCNHKGAWIILQTLFGGGCLLAWQLGEPCITTEDAMRCSSLSTPQPASTLIAFFSQCTWSSWGGLTFFSHLHPLPVYWLGDSLLFGSPAKLDFLSFYLELFCLWSASVHTVELSVPLLKHSLIHLSINAARDLEPQRNS